jgi:membrane protease YdiL (CAAX protease family)
MAALVTTALSWIFLIWEGRTLASMGWGGGRRWLWEFGAGLLGGFLLMGTSALVILGLGGFHWIRGTGGAEGLVSGAMLFLVVAFREEVLFRGYAFQRLVDGIGPSLALPVAGLWFAYAHWHNPGMSGATRVWGTLNIGLAGLLLGLCYMKTKRLALPIGVHLGWNWTQGSLLGFSVSGLDSAGFLSPVLHEAPSWLTGGGFGLEASLPCAIVTILAMAGLWRWKPAILEGRCSD